MDAGSEDTLLQASQFVASLESRQGLGIACLEGLAWRMGFISDADLSTRAQLLSASPYGRYLSELSTTSAFAL